MSSLTSPERECFESVFGMESGKVLKFSDDSFERFFEDYGVDIHGSQYRFNGDSKAKKMRAFWKTEPDDLVGRVLADLLDVYEVQSSSEVWHSDSAVLNKCREIVSRLTGVSIREFFNTSEGVPNSDFQVPNVSRLPVDSAVSEIIRDRLEEVQKCLSVGAHLAVIFLCGSILEGVLLGVAMDNPERFNRSKSSPKDQSGTVTKLRNWNLWQLINVACDIGLLKMDSSKFSHILRDFRNYIHPNQQLKEDFHPDSHTSDMCFRALLLALADLSDDR